MTATTVWMSDEILDRIERAVERVKARLKRASAALNAAGITYAVVGGNAVSAWVSTIDPEAARHTRDVDFLVRRQDYNAIRSALESAGFIAEEVLGVPVFLDGVDGKPSAGIHLLFEGEKVKPDYATAVPRIEAGEVNGTSNIMGLEGLLTMKLQSYRRKDQVHIIDMINVGLIDATWLDRVPPILRDRLQTLLDDPEG